MTHDVIIHSFKAFWISSSTDGSDDGFTHYLNPGGVAHSYIEAISTETVNLNNGDGDDDDSFASNMRLSLMQTSVE